MSCKRVSLSPGESEAPVVSVFIPVYNASDFLHRCLDSVLQQTFQDFEIIAVDDCSLDNSLDILLDYSRKDSRIHVFQNSENCGVSITCNNAIKQTRGEFLARLDSDDAFMPDKLASQYQFFKEKPEYVMIGGATLLVDTVTGNERVYYSPESNEDIVKKLFAYNPFQQSAVMINRSLIPGDFEFFFGELPVAEDLDLVFRIKKLGKLYNSKSVLAVIYERPGSLSHSDVARSYKYILKVRNKAINEYGYKPGMKVKLFMFCQKLAVAVIPSRFLFSIYYFIRKFI